MITRTIPAITETQEQAVREYTDVAYLIINDNLRTEDSLLSLGFPFAQQWIIDAPDELIQNSTLVEDTVLYRGIDSQSFYDKVVTGQLDSFIDKGFISTSVKPAIATEFIDHAEHPVVFMIHAKAEQHAVDLEPVTAVKGEHEILLSHDTEFRVLHAESTVFEHKDVLLVEVEIV